MNTRRKSIFVAGCLIACGMSNASQAVAESVSCAGVAAKVSAVADPAPAYIDHLFNSTQASFQPVLSTVIKTDQPGCVAAHLSGMARITDNYVVMQVKIDGKLMNGHHLTGIGGEKDQPIVYVALDEGDPNVSNDEQLTDPVKPVAYNFFEAVDKGVHTVEVVAAAGSGVAPKNVPSLQNLVMTLEHP